MDTVPDLLFASATLWDDSCEDRLTEAESVAVLRGRLRTILSIVTFPQPHSLTLSSFVIVKLSDYIMLLVFCVYLCVTQRFELLQKNELYIICIIIISLL